MEKVRAWQDRPLDPVYPIAISMGGCENGAAGVENLAGFGALGMNTEGPKST